MVSAILFDIDGVIVDSEPLHDEILRAVLTDGLGLTVQNGSLDHIGLSLPATLEVLGVPVEAHASASDLYTKTYCDAVSSSLLREGVEEVWATLIKRAIPFGCVTSAERMIALANLAPLASVATPPIIAREDVTQTKPHPEPYLQLIEILGQSAKDCVAIEDSDTGLTSANAAGVGTCLAFPHGASAGQSYTLAQRQLTHLTDILEML